MRATRLALFRLHNKDGSIYESEKLSGKHVLIYFSAHWCPPCRHFTPVLAKFYEKHKDSKNFEVLFASWDNDEGSFKKYHAEEHGSWPAFYYSERKFVENLQNMYDVLSIPTLIVLDSNGKLITKHGREMVLSDPEALQFPWKGMEPAPGPQARQRTQQQVLAFLVALLALWFLTTPRPPRDMP
jgi:nucleoredoxin